MDVLRNRFGDPVVFYHGTRRVFERLQSNALGLIHFSEDRRQAEEFAQDVRGQGSSPIGDGRIIAAHLKVSRLFDCADPVKLNALADRLDWACVLRELEDLSQSPWDEGMARRWLAQGQWQLLELPSVLAEIRSCSDGLVMHELGARNIAVFDPDQVVVIDILPLAAPRARRTP